MSPFTRCATVGEAVGRLTALVEAAGQGDVNYFRSQVNRYAYSVARIVELRPPPCRVLDIGSHYLHQAALLSLMGYEVTGIDVPLFAERAFIVERAAAAHITNVPTTGHQAGDFLSGQDGQFDIVVCTEFLEHIAFNPVAFWRRVWQLMKPGGMIYLTTPNAFRLRQLVRQVGRLASLDGIGLPVDEVFGVITYGHHWKEYSVRELHRYFRALSPDFSVVTRTYRDSERSGLAATLLEALPPCRTNIEAVVTVHGHTSFLEPPRPPGVAPERRPGVAS